MFPEYDVVYRLRYGKMKESKYSEMLELGYFSDRIYKFTDRLGGNEEYIKSQITGNCYFVKKKEKKEAIF